MAMVDSHYRFVRGSGGFQELLMMQEVLDQLTFGPISKKALFHYNNWKMRNCSSIRNVSLDGNKVRNALCEKTWLEKETDKVY